MTDGSPRSPSPRPSPSGRGRIVHRWLGRTVARGGWAIAAKSARGLGTHRDTSRRAGSQFLKRMKKRGNGGLLTTDEHGFERGGGRGGHAQPPRQDQRWPVQPHYDARTGLRMSLFQDPYTERGWWR